MAIAGDLIFKIVGGFAVDGLRRTYQEVRAGTRRRQTLDKVLSGNTQTDDDRLKRAFDDLNILIGNGRGELTESVAAFLREIERSAIPEAITRCVLTNGDARTIYPAFEVIYGSFTGALPFPCQRFFDAFYAAIKLSIEAEVKDPALLEFIQTQHIEFTKQLAGVAKSLAASSQGTALEFEEVLAARARLARSLDLYALADGFRESMIVTEDINSDAGWRLVDEMVADVMEGRGPTRPQFNSSHHLELDSKMHDIVRRIYMRLTTQKWKNDHDRYIKLLYLAAFTIEGFERFSAGKSNHRKIRRFENYAPAGVVERIFDSIEDHPLLSTLRKWNNRDIQLAR